MTIYVSSLADMRRLVRRFAVRDLVSIIQPDAQPPTPPEVKPERHYRCPVDDIVEPRPGEILPQADHVEELITFLRTWDGEAPLLTHCHAGVSRSSAVALIAHVLQSGNPVNSVKALREASPYAWPNRRIVALADSIMGFDGALVDARQNMGAPIWETDPDYVKEPGRFTTLVV
ncbi:MAG: protein tyrosine phosphatase [Gammaproteobacteria bacterium]|nr:protein tyrosine phosphatase [Gammaproteobacteria bacterium]